MENIKLGKIALEWRRLSLIKEFLVLYTEFNDMSPSDERKKELLKRSNEIEIELLTRYNYDINDDANKEEVTEMVSMMSISVPKIIKKS